jgi:hypothetical protein
MLNDFIIFKNSYICVILTQQTGVDKYAIVEASVVHDLTKKTCWLVLKVDDYDDYIGNWSQRSFGGTILSLTQMPLKFTQNNFENYLDLIITVPAKTQITLQMVKKCEDVFHLTNMERIMSNPDGTKLVPTNRFKSRAVHMLAYISACNGGIVLGGTRYTPETATNHSYICGTCGLANCRSSKKKPCQSNPRCMKCSETNHRELGCKKPDYCINCQRFGHKCNHDDYCPIFQQKTFDNNTYMLPVWVGEGIKSSKYLIRNATIAMANAEKEEEATSKANNIEVMKEICETYVQQTVIPRVTSLEAGQIALNHRCDQTEAIVAGLVKTQMEQTGILSNLQTTANQTNNSMGAMMDILTRISNGLVVNRPTPLTPPNNDNNLL